MNALLVEMLMKLLGLMVGELGQMAIAAIMKLASREVVDRVTNLAITHVEILADAVMDGPEKKKLAFDGIKKDCATLGIDARDWLIDTAIQAAVGKLKVDMLAKVSDPVADSDPEPEVA